MAMRRRTKRKLIRFVSYILVAVLSAIAALVFVPKDTWVYNVVSNGVEIKNQTPQEKKLSELAAILDTYFVGDVDDTKTAEAMAASMVDALGDRWSYYMSADEYKAYKEQMNNAYVGIGVTISTKDDSLFEVQRVEEGSGAESAGIQPGDKIITVEGQSVQTIGLNKAKALIKGKEDTQVNLTVLRDGEEINLSVTRKTVLVKVATAQMLDNNIGLVSIANFDDRCADETIAAVEELVGQGAKALIFDVRFNPGGYKAELVKILDHLLPKGELFHSVNYKGEESRDYSDDDCLELPMAVLINQDSYSAAEFFAAALNEYGWATTVGEHTVGKGHFQNTFQLSDGSAVALSIGKYYTPKGVSLSEVGGLKPDVTVELDKDTQALIYAGDVDPKEDLQIQAAVDVLLDKIG